MVLCPTAGVVLPLMEIEDDLFYDPAGGSGSRNVSLRKKFQYFGNDKIIH